MYDMKFILREIHTFKSILKKFVLLLKEEKLCHELPAAYAERVGVIRENSENQLISLLSQAAFSLHFSVKRKNQTKHPTEIMVQNHFSIFLGRFVLNYLLDSKGNNFC